jgi:hypothetical protein
MKTSNLTLCYLFQLKSLKYAVLCETRKEKSWQEEIRVIVRHAQKGQISNTADHSSLAVITIRIMGLPQLLWNTTI